MSTLDTISRDEKSNAILNRNGIGLDNYKKARQLRREKKMRNEELEDRVANLEAMVKALIDKLT